MARTALHGGWLVGWIDGQHQVLDGGTVVFEDDTILFVGFPNDPACPMADVTIEANGKLVSPGLINLHCVANLDLQLLKMDSKGGESLPKPKAYVVNPEAPLLWSDQDFRNSAEFAVATLLKEGATTFASVTTSATKRWGEASPEPYALAEASGKLGARAWLAHFYQEACQYTESDGSVEVLWDRHRAQEALDQAIDLVKFLAASGDSRLTGFLFPARTDRCSDDLLKETMSQAEALGGLHVRSHFSEYLHEYQEFTSRNPSRTMVEWLRDVGFLGPNVCLTHVIYVAGHSATGEAPRDDLRILAESGTSACHCPLVIARAGVALESFSRYVAAGINMGIGTDTFPPSLVEEMRLAALVNKVVDRDRGAGTIHEVYDAVTIGGARALGREDLGRLAPGCRADISVFDLSGLEIGIIDDPMRAFVHAATGRECDLVIVDGRVVVEDGRVVGVDEEDLKRRAQQSWLKYTSGLASWDWKRRPIDQLMPTALPTIRDSRRPEK